MFALKKLLPAAIAAMALCYLPACSENGAKGAPVVKVNGSVITKPELDRAVKALLAQNRVKEPLPQEQMDKATQVALEQLTAAELLYQEAKKLEIKDLDQLVEEKFKQNRAKFPTPEEYEKTLKTIGMTDEEVREAMSREIVVNNFVQKQFSAKATCSEEQARKFYEDNKEKLFLKGERVAVSHILVGVEQKGAPQDKQKAKEKAEALLNRVQNGEDFAEVARKESTCPSKAEGGDLGVFGRGRMTPVFEQAAFALQKKGELSPVVATEYGYHIIKLKEKISPSTEKYEEVREKIVQFLKQEQVRKSVAEFVGKLRGKAKIEKV